MNGARAMHLTLGGLGTAGWEVQHKQVSAPCGRGPVSVVSAKSEPTGQESLLSEVRDGRAYYENNRTCHTAAGHACGLPKMRGVDSIGKLMPKTESGASVGEPTAERKSEIIMDRLKLVIGEGYDLIADEIRAAVQAERKRGSDVAKNHTHTEACYDLDSHLVYCQSIIADEIRRGGDAER